MGKMKELFIQMQEQAADEARDNFNVEEPIMASNKEPVIMCPNCYKGTLTFYYTIKEAICEKCGYKFVKVDDKTVRFK
tara:strand:- start:320 stop:553 length:234 start_codon:yes stop_codon:yes gene_type:complete